MFIIVYILEGLAIALSLGLMLLYWLVFARVLISWVSPDPSNPIVQFLRAATDPLLEPLRQLMMPLTMKIRIDLSCILAFFIIGWARQGIVGLLLYLAYLLK